MDNEHRRAEAVLTDLVSQYGDALVLEAVHLMEPKAAASVRTQAGGWERYLRRILRDLSSKAGDSRG